MVYSPKEDSYLLETEVTNYLKNLSSNEKDKIKILDMGSGWGIQALACIKSGIKKSNTLCVDIDNESIKELKRKKLRVIKSNLFLKIKNKTKFDLIIFNAPYLPEDEYDKKIDTTAGKKGYETIIKFLKQAKKHLAKNGTILLLFSNLSKPKIILSYAKKNKYSFEKIAEQNMGFFETILVYKFSLSGRLK
jgi:HemK-related putative methylase